MRKRILIFLILATLSLTAASCGSPPEKLEPLEGSVSAFSTDIIEKLVAEDFDGVVYYFNAEMRKALPVRKLQPTWKQLTNQFGPYKREVAKQSISKEEHTILITTAEFDKAFLDIRTTFDKDNRVAGLYFLVNQEQTAKAYSPPPYADPALFTEKEVSVGQGEWALPATLTIPSGEGPHPAVVLVHGSGPNDRDETIGPNKPFKDLAWGLANRGIAVLRYEKRTAEHGEKMASQLDTITPQEEVIDDALAAIILLRATPEINTARIFVLGHSLGGTLAPRIAEQDPEIAGLIILAGAARPLEDVILEQVRYLAELDGTVTPEEQSELTQMEELVARVKDPNLPADTSPRQLPLGMPAPYWLYLRSYDPVETAGSLEMPLFIIQGERDYQVTMEDFSRWQSTLKNNENVKFKSYPYLNHLFIGGNGNSTPSEYMEPGNVSYNIVTDIANWVNSR